MSPNPPTPPSTPEPALFKSRAPEAPARSLLPAAIAVVAALLVAGILIFATHRKPVPPANAVLPLDPYAAQLAISGIQMSESTSLSGGKSTFIDGHVQNNGPQTVNGVTVQVLFNNDTALPPQIETLPLTLVRTREPYVDTQPVAASPLRPGQDREFRLIFENIGSNWNGQVPEIHFVRVTSR